MHEVSFHAEPSSFITLTYDEARVAPSLEYGDFQKFMKRLRKLVGPTRFFCCGEYGSINYRPHFHSILFGYFFPDAQVFSESKGNVLYRSAILEKLWPYGFSSFGNVTPDSAAYVAGYALKKVSGDPAKAHYTRLDPSTGELVEVVPEFAHMSRRPGIGHRWIEKFKDEVYSESFDGVVQRGGFRRKSPRYYDKYLKDSDPYLYEAVELQRSKRTEEQIRDMEMSRLRVREAVVKARLKFKERLL